MRFASIATFAAVAIASVCGATTSEMSMAASEEVSATADAAASSEAPAASDEAKPECKTLAEIAAGNPDFSILAELVTGAGLLPALNGTEGTLTVFAPTNEAFKKFNESNPGVLESLQQENATMDLVGVLTYHVINATVVLKDLKDGEELTTLNGQNVTVKIEEHEGEKVPHVLINGVTLNSTVSVPACNGEVFILEDGVLVPPPATTEGAEGSAEASAEPSAEASEPAPEASESASA